MKVMRSQHIIFFKEVIEMNANLEFAYAGIGKALLRQGDYKGAMENFKKKLRSKKIIRKRFCCIVKKC